MSFLPYNNSDIESILFHAEKLVGKQIYELLLESDKKIDIKNKGAIGTIIEEFWFGIMPNSSPKPDFDKVGIELKIIPLIQQKKRLSVKERTKICSINYQTLIDESWESSHAKEKLNKILFIYYLYNKENIENSIIKKVDLWELSKDKSELIIKHDWLNTKQKVLNGYAHELSEKYFKILSPARSGSGGVDKNGRLKDLVTQPNKLYANEALKRAFTLKQSFTNQRWNEINYKIKYESILESLHINNVEEFEYKILKNLHKYTNKSIYWLSQIFEISINNSKNQVATIIKKAIGFKNVKSNIKEFEQLGILVKTIKVREDDDMPLEAISFASMKLKEFIEEEWEESTFKTYINKILFVPVYHISSKLEEKYLGKCFFWSPSFEEEKIIYKEWKMYQNEVKNGACKVRKIKNNSKKGYKEVSQLSKESQTDIVHMRPHGRNSNDRDIDSFGNSIVKQCFWFNKKFMQKLIKDNK
jgi:DNA mismatch repair endonuclease MutH